MIFIASISFTFDYLAELSENANRASQFAETCLGTNGGRSYGRCALAPDRHDIATNGRPERAFTSTSSKHTSVIVRCMVRSYKASASLSGMLQRVWNKLQNGERSLLTGIGRTPGCLPTGVPAHWLALPLTHQFVLDRIFLSEGK